MKKTNKDLTFGMDADLHAESVQTTKKTLKKSNMQSTTPETCMNGGRHQKRTRFPEDKDRPGFNFSSAKETFSP